MIYQNEIIDTLKIRKIKIKTVCECLDALCKKFNIDTKVNGWKKGHGALVDCYLLISVFGNIQIVNNQILISIRFFMYQNLIKRNRGKKGQSFFKTK